MFDQKSIASKWQKAWNEKKIFKTRDKSKKPKFYCLEMFPYPSAYGLHMGHVRNYCIGDTIARYKRMKGFNVLYPMGFDAFGLPAENAAIKQGIHPREYTEKAMASLESSLKRIGLSYDWERKIATCYPEYYKWNQYFFIKFFEKGLAYKKKAPINWCPSCGTVLANEQVVEGKCWRCESVVEIRDLEQWFLKITDYAEELLNDVDKLNWPERIKLMQKNWIGKSEGTLVNFKSADSDLELPVFTTRIDTLFSVTFLVIAPEHPLVHELVHGTKYEEYVKKFVNKVVLQEKFERTAEEKEKEGVFIGKYAINPANDKRIPIYIANFVLIDYGTGIVMADAHDKRDVDFAKKYGIPLVTVLKHKDGTALKSDEIYTDFGMLQDSGQFTGFTSEKAIPKMQEWLEQIGKGKKIITYKLRDWLISRQRYWGTPIPIIYCEICGVIPVLEKDLPVKLPDEVQFTGKGNPLANYENFVNTKCPKCGKPSKRETDTMDTFVDSSWYFLRYTSSKEKKFAFDKKKTDYWLPVDQYIGGAEHAVLHLLYARFFTKVLRDMGFLKFSEPFLKLFNQGIVHKEGKRMSKSHGNIISQEEVETKYGIDCARLFMLFVAGPGKDIEWNDQSVQGSNRFINRIDSIYDKPRTKKLNKQAESKINSLIKTITEYLNEFELNKAIVELMNFAEYLESKQEIPLKVLENYTLLMAPFMPHVSEELWEKTGKKTFACRQKWPKYDQRKINPEFEYEDKIISKTKRDIDNVLNLAEIQKPSKITIIIAEEWKNNLYDLFKKEFEHTKNSGEMIKKLMQTELRKHGELISKLIPKLISNPSEVPQFVIGQKKEFFILEAEKTSIAKKYNCAVEIIEEQDSKEQKAKQAMPGKPAIIIS